MKNLLLILLCTAPAVGHADEFDFDEDIPEPSGKPTEASGQELYSLPLRFNAGLSLGRQTGKPARWIRQGLDLNTILDWSTDYGLLYGEGNLVWNQAFRRESDPQETIDAWEKQGILRELYWSSNHGPVSVVAGRQIVVTGKGDFLSVLDLVSPSDQSQLFFADPEDARLGQDLLRTEIYPVTGHSLSLLYSPRAVGNRMVDRSHPYQSLPAHSQETRLQKEWNAIYRFTDDQLELSLNGGRVHQRIPLLEADPGTGNLRGIYQPFTYAGFAMTWSMTGWLWKGEAAWYSHYAYQGVADSGLPGPVYRDVRAAMVGFDYVHDDLGTFTAEGNILSPVDSNEFAKVHSLYAFSWSRQYLRDDLQLSLSHLGFDRMANQLNRAGISFRVDDTWRTEMQYTNISVKDEDFRSFEHLDRFDLAIKAGFSF